MHVWYKNGSSLPFDNCFNYRSGSNFPSQRKIIKAITLINTRTSVWFTIHHLSIMLFFWIQPRKVWDLDQLFYIILFDNLVNFAQLHLEMWRKRIIIHSLRFGLSLNPDRIYMTIDSVVMVYFGTMYWKVFWQRCLSTVIPLLHVIIFYRCKYSRRLTSRFFGIAFNCECKTYKEVSAYVKW